MDIETELTEFEEKLKELDALSDEYDKARDAGDEIGMRRISKAEEKLADELEVISENIANSDLSEVHAELEAEETSFIAATLREKANALNGLIDEYDRAAKAGNQLGAYKVLTDIRKLGRELMRFEGEFLEEGED